MIGKTGLRQLLASRLHSGFPALLPTRAATLQVTSEALAVEVKGRFLLTFDDGPDVSAPSNPTLSIGVCMSFGDGISDCN